MPIYLYENPDTGEVKEIVQRMSEPHIYIEHGITWRLVFCIPQESQVTIGNLDPFD